LRAGQVQRDAFVAVMESQRGRVPVDERDRIFDRAGVPE
jgi:hypothetical protein